MDDHQTLSVAFLGSLLSSLLILIDWPLLGASKDKNKNTFQRLLLQNYLMDDYQILYVEFLGSILSSLIILIRLASFKGPLKLKIEKPLNIISY
jgi:hypothetical protein